MRGRELYRTGLNGPIGSARHHRQEIARYVALDNPIDCAGAYKIERGGIALFDRITAGDLTAITGMPMLRLCAVLRQFGVSVP